jgi:hypothetical protein
MLSFCAESFDFQFTIQKCKDYDIYRTIILPFVLYGCETWLLTLKEECRLRVFENRVLRRIFGHKRDEVTEEWRRLVEVIVDFDAIDQLLNRCCASDTAEEMGMQCSSL